LVFSKDEQIQDGDQLARVLSELGPLDRLLKRKKDELFAQWANDEQGKLSRDFCAGALSVIDTLMSDIDQLIKNADALRAEEAEMEAAAKSQALEGGGHGDLAS